MQQGSTPKPTRRPRADGERNRARLLEAAKCAFAKGGAAVSLEQIAREADVSIASLYRHFPTRNELISAVYQQEVTTLIEAADQLITERKPAAALREWLMLFVEFLDAKHGMAEAMDTLIGGPEPLYSKTPHRLDIPIKALVAGGIAKGAAPLFAAVCPYDHGKAHDLRARPRSGILRYAGDPIDCPGRR